MTSARPRLLDQSALEQGLHHAIHGHAANLLDLRPRDGLAVGDDGQRLQCRLGKPRRPGTVAHQRLDPGGKLRQGHELPRAGHTHQPKRSRGGFMLAGQLLQRGGDGLFPGFFQRLHLFVAFGVLQRAGQHIPNFFRAERLFARRTGLLPEMGFSSMSVKSLTWRRPRVRIHRCRGGDSGGRLRRGFRGRRVDDSWTGAPGAGAGSGSDRAISISPNASGLRRHHLFEPDQLQQREKSARPLPSGW